MIGSLADISSLLVALGMGDVDASRPVRDIVREARERALALREENRLLSAQNRDQRLAAPVYQPPPVLDYGTNLHEMQHLAVDLDGDIHIHGSWVGHGGDDQAKAETSIRGDMIALQAAGIDLVLVRYQRCRRLDLTTIMPGGEEVDNLSISV